MWSVVQGSVSGVSQATINAVLSLTQSAANYWGWYVNDNLANITIRVTFEDLAGTTLATGGTDFQFLNSQGGLDFFEPSTVRELRTGTDPNGSSPDIRISVDSSRLASNGFYLGAPVDGYISSPNPGQTDLFTVLLHEIGHGLGLLTFLDDPGNDRTTFDRHVTGSGANRFFNGPNAVAAFGGPIPLDDGIAHVAQSLSFRLFRPAISSGVASFINPFEVAFVQDFGVPIRAPGAGADSLHGYTGNDAIDALGGDDFINGLIGDDTLTGGLGADTLEGDKGNDQLFGGDDADALVGADGNDRLSGGAGADVLQGGAFNDTLEGGAGSDTIDGGDGFDLLSYAGSSVGVSVILGAGANSAGDAEGDVIQNVELLIGSVFADTLAGGDGGDQINGGGGDLLIGGAGDDTVFATPGDTVLGGAGADRITFNSASVFTESFVISYALSPGSVRVNLATQAGELNDAEGDIYIFGRHVTGSQFDDTLIGSAGSLLEGGAGADLLIGNEFPDTLLGGAGPDTVRGGLFVDILDGGTAFDTLDYSDRTDGGVNVNVINGEALTGGSLNAQGLYVGGAQEDVISNFENILGTDFADRLIAGSTSARIEGRGGNDYLFTFSGNDTLFGGDGSDFISAARSSDQLFGEAGADTLNGGTSYDTLNGGSDADTADYADRTGGVSVNLFSGFARTAGALNASGFYTGGFTEDVLVSIENAFGSEFGDRLVAMNAGSRLEGRGGADNISGLNGADTLAGGIGADTLDGGGGDDLFLFASGDGADFVRGFVTGDGADAIRLIGLGLAFDSFEEVIAVAVEAGADTVFDFGGGDRITVANAVIAQFTASDFLFG